MTERPFSSREDAGVSSGSGSSETPRPAGGRPTGKRPAGNRPTGNRPAGNRPARRRFAGTRAQITSALKFYKVMAYITGIFLILLCLEMLLRYGMGYDLIAFGTDAATQQQVLFGLNQRQTNNLTGGINLSTGVLIVHGWLYVVYLIADFWLWSLMRWPFLRFIVIALGGVVPGLSFIMERKVHRETVAELEANPKAVRRY